MKYIILFLLCMSMAFAYVDVSSDVATTSTTQDNTATVGNYFLDSNLATGDDCYSYGHTITNKSSISTYLASNSQAQYCQGIVYYNISNVNLQNINFTLYGNATFSTGTDATRQSYLRIIYKDSVGTTLYTSYLIFFDDTDFNAGHSLNFNSSTATQDWYQPSGYFSYDLSKLVNSTKLNNVLENTTRIDIMLYSYLRGRASTSTASTYYNLEHDSFLRIGEWSATPINVTPSIIITNPVNQNYTNTYLQVVYNVTNGTCDYVNGDYYTFIQGNNNLVVTCTNGSNTNTSSVSFFIDSIAPDAYFTANTDTAQVFRDNIIIDYVGDILYFYNSTNLMFNTTSKQINVTDLANGNYHFQVISIDNFGNTAHTEMRYVRVNKFTPTPSVVTPTPTITNSYTGMDTKIIKVIPFILIIIGIAVLGGVFPFLLSYCIIAEIIMIVITALVFYL